MNKEPCLRRHAITGAVSIVLVLCLLSSRPVSAGRGSLWRHPYAGKKRQRIIGMLELASIFRPDEVDVQPEAGIPIKLEQPIRAYVRPSTKAPIRALLKTADDVETRNDPYQRPAAPVFDVNDHWYLIGVKKPGGRMAKAWVTTKNGNAFSWLDFVILIADNSCYVTDSWDQKVWTAPSAHSKFRKLAKIGTKDFTVTDSNWNGDELWLEVEFTARVNCDSEELPPVLAKGWIRAYGPTEEMQVWFHPRSNC